MPKYALGCRPDTPDQRDKLFLSAAKIDAAALPPKVSLRSGFPYKPWNQGTLGSCTGQAIAGILSFCRKKQGLEVFVPSRLFIYYNERMIEGTVNSDAGAEIRNGLKSVATKGACPEEDWPHDIDKFAVRPSSKAYANAFIHRAIEFQRIPLNILQIKKCLADGFPYAGGISVYSSFMGDKTASNGIVSMPLRRESLEGGHAIDIIGYDDEKQMLEGRNSWDVEWGDEGHFWLPYEYAVNPNLASDNWTIKLLV
jgi:C1A family cysteine protease